MKTALAFVLALIAAATPASCTLHAQPQMVQPEPLSRTDPRAKQASALVEFILKGDRAGLVGALRADSTPAFAKSPEFDEAVDAQIARLANKGYGVTGFMTGRGADVLVELESPTAEATNIVVRFTVDPPHKVEGFTMARLVAGSTDAAGW